eukprot:3736114-Pyramimonas_sp.AAC.1
MPPQGRQKRPRKDPSPVRPVRLRSWESSGATSSWERSGQRGTLATEERKGDELANYLLRMYALGKLSGKDTCIISKLAREAGAS